MEWKRWVCREGRSVLENRRVEVGDRSMKEIAILMAAGLGNRMRPLTETTPKPLIRVHGKAMIETVIDGLLERPVEEIYIVTGYLGEQFAQLCEKYSQVRILYNPDYLTKNNISSIYAAREALGTADCFICESDLYVADSTIFKKKLTHSCYFGRMQAGYSDDWVFELDGDYISRVGKGGQDVYNMVGISYFKKEDARVLREEIEKAFAIEENSQLFWDDVVNQNLDKLKLTIEPVVEGQLVEIDTVEELNRVEAQ